MKNFLPAARTTAIVVQELENEVLVYDMTSHNAYCLNRTAALVYMACDGLTPYEELRAKYELTDEMIELAIAGLDERGLLAETIAVKTAGRRIDRREALRKAMAASAMALPLIASIAAPPALHAASACPVIPCASAADCFNPACPSCSGTGLCSVGGAPCASIGVACAANGTCTGGICTAPGGVCFGLPDGTPCFSTGTCIAGGTCH